jgi:hypothetical protein
MNLFGAFIFAARTIPFNQLFLKANGLFLKKLPSYPYLLFRSIYCSNRGNVLSFCPKVHLQRAKKAGCV